MDHELTQTLNRNWPGEAGALIQWAEWASDSLAYLVHLDEEAFGAKREAFRFHPDLADLAHVRWAASTAITAVDLCAAALGRRFVNATPKQDLSLRKLDPTNKNPAPKNYSRIPAGRFRTWVDQVLASSDYRLLLELRHPLVHARLGRIVYGSTRPSGPHEHRIDLRLRDDRRIAARDVVLKSRTFGKEQVDGFIQAVLAED